MSSERTKARILTAVARLAAEGRAATTEMVRLAMGCAWTAATIRKHLSSLRAEGLVDYFVPEDFPSSYPDWRRGVRVWELTAAGRERAAL